jgi:hypothetical protein
MCTRSQAEGLELELWDASITWFILRSGNPEGAARPHTHPWQRRPTGFPAGLE